MNSLDVLGRQDDKNCFWQQINHWLIYTTPKKRDDQQGDQEGFGAIEAADIDYPLPLLHRIQQKC